MFSGETSGFRSRVPGSILDHNKTRARHCIILFCCLDLLDLLRKTCLGSRKRLEFDINGK